MKRSGIIRKIDNLGRIVIPMEIRKLLNINLQDDMEFYINENNEVVIKRVSISYNFNDIASIVCDKVYSSINEPTFVTNLQQIISFKGDDIVDLDLSSTAKEIVKKPNFTSFNGGNGVEITSDKSYYAEIFMPIIKDKMVVGSIIVASKSNNFELQHIRYLKLAVGILEIFINE